MKRKYKITTAKNAVEKGLVKVGDIVTVKYKVTEIKDDAIIVTKTENSPASWIFSGIKIRIPIPEPKQIDFGEAGRVLKSDGFIVMTTGYCHEDSKCFSGYLLQDTEESKKGYTSNNWAMQEIWQDITDTYNL